MTTICYKDGLLVSDTMTSFAGIYCGRGTKIIDIPELRLIAGFAGRLADKELFFKWLCEGSPKEKPVLEEEGEGMVIDDSGKTTWYNRELNPFRYSENGLYWASGSGFQIALGAMAAGASAYNAVKIACDFDSLSRLPADQLERYHEDEGKLGS